MKINIDILYENLKDIFEIVVRGASSKTLTLRRVEFFDPPETLQEDVIYIASCDMIDEYAQALKGMSLICLGGEPACSYSQSDSSLLLIKDSIGIVKVFHAVQQVFIRYETWEDELIEILRTTANLLDMVRVSVPIFGNPIQISDNQFNLIARTNILQRDKNGNIESYTVEHTKTMKTSEIMKFLKTDHPKDVKKKKPYFSKDSMYCINLFVHNRFAANMHLIPFIRPFLSCDLLLFEFFSGFVEEALCKYTKISNNQVHTRKSMLKDLLNQKPTDQNWHHQIAENDHSYPERYVFIKVQFYGEGYALPIESVCQTLEQLLPGCMAFEHHSTIAAFLSLADCTYSYEESLKIFAKFLEDMDFQAGISDKFEDIQNARQYYLQAACAIKTGVEIHPGKRYYLFEDYAISYMLKRCVGEMEAEFICPRGLVKLRERDESVSGDYWKTLRVYLENEMNATETAKQLFLHRSTLMQKLTRIYSILNVDIRDPMKRLYIQLCMCLMDITM